MKRRLALLPVALGLCWVAVPRPVQSGQPEVQPTLGEGYTVRPIGAGTATVKLSGAVKIWLKGDGSTRRGNGKINGLQLESCSQILVTDLTFTGYYQGCRLNACRDVEFRKVTNSRNKQQGWLLNNSSGVTLRNCLGERTAVQHSFYAGTFGGGRTQNILIEDSEFRDSKLAEVQCNAESASAAAKNFVLRRTTVSNPVFSVNLLSTQQFVFDACTITSKRKALSLDRSYGKPWPSTGVSMNGTKIVGNIVTGSGSSLKKQ